MVVSQTFRVEGVVWGSHLDVSLGAVGQVALRLEHFLSKAHRVGLAAVEQKVTLVCGSLVQALIVIAGRYCRKECFIVTEVCSRDEA